MKTVQTAYFCPSESAEQRLIFTWANVMAMRTAPELELMYAVPNGGSRRPIEAAIMKCEGVKAGVPDIHLPVSRTHHSLYIELKRKYFAEPDTYITKLGTVSDEQLDWLGKLNEQGHWAVICRGHSHAQKTIDAYMSNDQGRLEELNQWWMDLSDLKRKRVTKTRKVRGRVRATRSQASAFDSYQ